MRRVVADDIAQSANYGGMEGEYMKVFRAI